MQTYILVKLISDGPTCSNNGASSRHKDFFAPVKEGGNYKIGDILSDYELEQILEVGSYYKDDFFLKPKSLAGHRPMNGGGFVHCSDSRFSETYGRRPVHLFDRLE